MKKSKYCCHSPFYPPIFCRHSLKLLSPTLPKINELDTVVAPTPVLIVLHQKFYSQGNKILGVTQLTIQLKCICIEIFDNFLLTNMKDGLKARWNLFTVC